MDYKLTFPCMNPIMVDIDKVKANNYNPNDVASTEMELLYTSIKEDGLTMAIVTFYDHETDTYVIVDGFHRYTIVKDWFHSNVIPVVVINKDICERVASTIRHNRARGVHKVDGMTEIVKMLVDKGWEDDKIANELGMSVEELLRLKQIKGIAKILANREYGREWTIK